MDRGVRTVTGPHCLAELLRQYRANHQGPLEFDPSVILDRMDKVKISVESLLPEDALALERWTAEHVGTDREYQAWKARLVLRSVSRHFHTALAEPANWEQTVALAVADCEHHADRRPHAPTTVDWLTIGQALRLGYTVVTEEKRGEYEAFHDKLTLDEALQRLEVAHA